MAIDHKSQHERVKAAMAELGHEISYHDGGSRPTGEPGNDFERPGERYYQDHAVSKERLESEYDRNKDGSYTHHARRK